MTLQEAAARRARRADPERLPALAARAEAVSLHRG